MILLMSLSLLKWWKNSSQNTKSTSTELTHTTSAYLNSNRMSVDRCKCLLWQQLFWNRITSCTQLTSRNTCFSSPRFTTNTNDQYNITMICMDLMWPNTATSSSRLSNLLYTPNLTISILCQSLLLRCVTMSNTMASTTDITLWQSLHFIKCMVMSTSKRISTLLRVLNCWTSQN